jgi:hypothetical protein
MSSGPIVIMITSRALSRSVDNQFLHLNDQPAALHSPVNSTLNPLTRLPNLLQQFHTFIGNQDPMFKTIPDQEVKANSSYRSTSYLP